MADSENPSEQQESVEEENKNNKKNKKKKEETNDVHLPVLVEFTYTFSSIILILLFLTMVSISFLTGATLLDTVIRTSITMLIIGGLLIYISRQISSGILTANIVQNEKSSEQQSEEMMHDGIENHTPSEVQ
jgi:hypothetical protein